MEKCEKLMFLAGFARQKHQFFTSLFGGIIQAIRRG